MEPSLAGTTVETAPGEPPDPALFGGLALNPEQARAASHGEGPALVLAGAGTGKTTALIGRYCHLVRQGVAPSAILATTFTRAAAEQLLGRIRAQAGIGEAALPVGTFHGLCFRWLQAFGERVGVPPDFAVIDEAAQFQLLRQLDPERGDLEELKEAIARFKDCLVTPEQAMAEAEQAPPEERAEHVAVARSYARYDAALRRRGVYDFGDLIALTVAALRADAGLRAALSRRYRYLLIDEYQDINPAQAALIGALTDQHANLWVVGDDDQAIYGWRGSDVRYILEFQARHPGAALYRLERNYRSPAVVLEAANRLIACNAARLGKTLQPTRAVRTRLVVIRHADEAAEAAWLLRAIKALVERGVPHREIAVLVRSGYLMVSIEAALRAADIPYEMRGGRNIWRLPEAQTVLYAAARAFPGAAPADRFRPLAYLRDEAAALARAEAPQGLAAAVRAAGEFVAGRAPFSASRERKVLWAGAVQRVVAEAQAFEAADAFFAAIAALAARRPTAKAPDAVVLSTIHQAKGLEWEAVFLAGCEAGVMPDERAEDPEEERRLAFVAITRAKRFLAVGAAGQRAGRRSSPSPYIREMTQGLSPEAVDRRGFEPPRQPRLIDAPPSLSPEALALIGRRVQHVNHGIGTIVGVTTRRWKVQFSRRKGVKRVRPDGCTLLAEAEHRAP